ncbi:MAG: phosphoethanolamine transferase [Bacteroidota bacterium]|nr:phosphoethanolamine transferase [Bacteroidota bacterium]
MKKNRLIQSIGFVIILFILSTIPILTSYFFKKFNPHEYGFLRGNKYDLEITYREVLFFSSIVFSFLIISIILKYVSARKWRNLLLYIPFIYIGIACFFILCDLVYYVVFGYFLTFSIIQTVINTNMEESADFIRLYSGMGTSVVILLFVSFIAFFIHKWKGLNGLFTSKPFMITALIISLYGMGSATSFYLKHNEVLTRIRYWDITLGQYNQYREFMEKIKQEMSGLQRDQNYKEFSNNDTLNKTFVFIISESLSKTHMSYYGFERETTPYADHNPDLYKFNNCMTPFTLTTEAVPSLFYGDVTDKKLNLFSVLNNLNYETFWISNQAGWGGIDNPIVLLSRLCDHYFFNDDLSQDEDANLRFHYDEDLIKPFNNFLNGKYPKKSKFIVLHLMGSHYDYEKRYPKDRNFFQSGEIKNLAVRNDKVSSIINAYDNSVKYQDSVVNCIYEILNKYSLEHNESAVMLFLADHGEELFEHRSFNGHTYPPTKEMADIPYFVYLSNRYKQNYPLKEKWVRQRINTPLSSKDNFFTLIDLLNIGSKKFGDNIKHKAFFNPAYDSTEKRSIYEFDYNDL